MKFKQIQAVNNNGKVLMIGLDEHGQIWVKYLYEDEWVLEEEW